MQGSNIPKVFLIVIFVICTAESYASNANHDHGIGNRNSNHGLGSSLSVSSILQKALQSGFKNVYSNDSSNLITFIQGYNGLANVLKNVSRKFVNRDIEFGLLQLEQFKVETNSLLSNGCTNALDGLFQLILTSKYGKIEKLLDAMGKPGSGLLQGDMVWLGSFQECKETDDSHYCLTEISVMHLTIKFGLCLPKECSEADTFKMLTVFANITQRVSKSNNAFGIHLDNSLNLLYGSPVICQKPPSYSSGTIIAFLITAIILLFVALGTVIDYFRGNQGDLKVVVAKSNGFMPVQNYDEQPLLAQNDVEQKKGNLVVEIFLCFSLRKNMAAILNTKVTSSAITSLNGIRTLSMFWVILGHTFFFALYAGTDNIVQGLKSVQRFSFQAIANAYFSVDTFFLLSGLLVSYLCLKRFATYEGLSFGGYFGKKFLPLYYAHRFLRLTPSYMYVILFYIFIFPFCGEGPLWFTMGHGPGITLCKKYWWTNMLYINNFYPKSMGEECIGWSWYLANDMQFYLISPIILLVMYKLRLPGTLILNGAICVISFAITGSIIGTYNLNSLLTGDFQSASTGAQAANFADWIYSKPYCRIPPYLVGLVLGYLLYNRKKPSGSVKYLVGIVGWMLAVGIGLAVTYAPYTSFKVGGRPFTLFENVVYGTFSRFGWGLCVAWVIYACHFGMGGVINTVLSWKAFIPMSRLTYSAYLVHPIVIYVFYNSLENPFHFSDISIVYYYTSFLTLTYSSAFLLAAFVEFPAMNLEKLVFRF